MSFKYNIGRSYLVRLRPVVLYPCVLKQIERSLSDQDISYVNMYNEDIEAFEVVADTYARKVSTLEAERPRGWSAWNHQYCLESDEPPKLNETSKARLQSLETELACHDLSQHVVAQGWFDLAYVSVD